MTERRPMGGLEDEILATLWRAQRPCTPADVLAGMDGGLAYTTVTTVLARLRRKGRVTRSQAGRAYAYEPTAGEADATAERMSRQLRSALDREAVLNRFVGELSPEEEQMLRRVLSELTGELGPG